MIKIPIQQAFNKRINAWVKFDFKKGKGFTVLDVKQRNPAVPFKGVKRFKRKR